MNRSRMWIRILLGLPFALSFSPLVAVEVTPPAEAPKAIATPEGTWYEVSLECAFCPSFEHQSFSLSKDANLLRYSDRLEIASNLKTARFVIKGESAEVNSRVARVTQQTAKDPLVIVQYAEGIGERTTDTFARIWILSPLAGGRILYGRRYLVSAFAEDAFEVHAKGYRAREKFLPPDRLQANLDDVRVFSLNENRKVYQPSAQVRFSLEGAVGYVREGAGEADIAAGKEQAQKQAQARAGRETLFRTFVQQGDKAYAAGNYDDALNRYKAASAILPEMSLVYADLGTVYQVQGKLPEAEASMRLALELDPTDVDSQFNLAQVLEQSGKLADALKLYQLVLEKRPQDAEAKERITRLTLKVAN